MTPPGVDFGGIFGALGPNFELLGASWEDLGPTFGLFLAFDFFADFWILWVSSGDDLGMFSACSGQVPGMV